MLGTQRLLDVLEDVASGAGTSPAEVALAWLMARPSITAPIASATSVAQVESFARAAQLTLNAAQLARLEIASA